MGNREKNARPKEHFPCEGKIWSESIIISPSNGNHAPTRFFHLGRSLLQPDTRIESSIPVPNIWNDWTNKGSRWYFLRWIAKLHSPFHQRRREVQIIGANFWIQFWQSKHAWIEYKFCCPMECYFQLRSGMSTRPLLEENRGDCLELLLVCLFSLF